MTPAGFSRTGLLFGVIGGLGLALPFVQFKPNRILAGEDLLLFGSLPFPAGWCLAVILVVALFAGMSQRQQPKARFGIALFGCVAVVIALGVAAKHLTPADDTLARISPAAGFWLLLLAFTLMLADGLGKAQPRLAIRWLLLVAAISLVLVILASGALDSVSVMREYAARSDVFNQAALGHLMLAYGSLALALLIGLPLGVVLYESPQARRVVLSTLNILQTIPSLALFGIMIPLFSWVTANIPGAATLGIAAIGPFPALMALFLYSLLPVVSNTLTGLSGVSPETREAAAGLGMTRPQILMQVLVPLALPVLLAAIRIVLVQNIGLAVIAGLIGGGGFGIFVFQGLNQTAMDLVLLGALPTIALALFTGIALDLLIEAATRTERKAV